MGKHCRATFSVLVLCQTGLNNSCDSFMHSLDGSHWLTTVKALCNIPRSIIGNSHLILSLFPLCGFRIRIAQSAPSLFILLKNSIISGCSSQGSLHNKSAYESFMNLFPLVGKEILGLTLGWSSFGLVPQQMQSRNSY